MNPEDIESPYGLLANEVAIKNAVMNGMDVIRGDDHTLLIDLDTQQDYNNFVSAMQILDGVIDLEIKDSWRSKSWVRYENGHTHVVVSCPYMSARERVLLQAALGSDRKRAAVSLVRLSEGVREPSNLFRPKHAQKVVWTLPKKKAKV